MNAFLRNPNKLGILKALKKIIKKLLTHAASRKPTKLQTLFIFCAYGIEKWKSRSSIQYKMMARNNEKYFSNFITSICITAWQES